MMSEFTKLNMCYDVQSRNALHNFTLEERISGEIIAPNTPNKKFHVVIPDGMSRNEVIIDKCVDHFKKALIEYLSVGDSESVEL
jgi:hypothetical protein